MELQALIFDLGGVLVELGGVEEFGELVGEPDESELWSRWLSSEWVRRYERGRCTREAFAQGMVEEFDLPMTPAAFLDLFLNWPRGLLPGARSLVHSLRPGFAVACLSNTNELHWEEQKDAESVHRLFERRFLSFEIGMVKPDREIFQYVTQALGCPAESIFFLDDNLINVEGARASGWQAEKAVGVLEAQRILAQRGLLLKRGESES